MSCKKNKNKPLKRQEAPDSSFTSIRARLSYLYHCESNRLPVVFHAGDNTPRLHKLDKESTQSSCYLY